MFKHYTASVAKNLDVLRHKDVCDDYYFIHNIPRGYNANMHINQIHLFIADCQSFAATSCDPAPQAQAQVGIGCRSP